MSDNCWKSSHNLWTLPNRNSRSLEDLGFRACYSASAQSPTAPFWKPNVLAELQESVPFEMKDKSLRVKLVIVNLLEHSLNQQISHFRSLNSSRKANIDESFGSSTSKLDTVLLLQPLRWCCVDCMIHHEWEVREEQKCMYMARTSNNRVISLGDLYCCLLPRCEAWRTCRSAFPIATKWCCDQDVEVVRSSAFTQRKGDRCGSL